MTIRDAEQVTRWLKSQELEVQSYTSASENKEELEQALLENQVKALVATTALSMATSPIWLLQSIIKRQDQLYTTISKSDELAAVEVRLWRPA